MSVRVRGKHSGTPRIDAHQHYWLLKRDDYGWITPDSGLLYADYLPEQLLPALQACGMDRTIVVQSAATAAETAYMLELCRQHESLAGVVGWINPGDASFQADLEQFASDLWLKGFRIGLPSNEQGRLVFDDSYLRNAAELAERGYPVDLLLHGEQLADAAELVSAVPGLRACINHIGNPSHTEEGFQGWQQAMERMAENPLVYCKFSGMVTRVPEGRDTIASLLPYARVVTDNFGPSRLLFGSDWPVCKLAAEYETVVDIAEALLDWCGYSEAAKEAVFGGNAVRFYHIR